MKSIKTVLILIIIFFLFFSISTKEPASSISISFPPYLQLQINPRSIAINPLTDRAVVTDFWNKKVSIIDLWTQNILSTISLSKMPLGMAIDYELNLAIVSHPLNNSVSVISLDSFQVLKNISVGMLPVGISVDSISHKALVSNFLSNSVSVIDLTTLKKLKTISVGLGPVDVAIDSELKLALVVNALGNNVSVIDLTSSQVIRTVSVGMIPVSVDINSETHVAGVVNLLSHSLTVIDLQDWETQNIEVGEYPLDVAINSLDNRALIICDLERRVLLIDLDTGTIVNEYEFDKRFTGVAVNPYMNIGALVDNATGVLTLIQLPNPVPEITSINPVTVFRGSPTITLMIEGSGFIKTSTVSSLQVNFIDNHHLEVELPESLLVSAGTYQIKVTNPSPDGGSSNPMDLRIDNPIPGLSRLEPTEAMAGLSELALTIHGTGFFNDSTVFINGTSRSFTLIDHTKLQIQLTTSDLEKGGYLEVKVSNPLPGGGESNALTFTVLNPVPSLSSLNPSSIIAGSPDFTLVLNGDNFVKTSTVSFNNQSFQSRYISKTQIEATIPANAITAPGSYPVKVINPTPGGGESGLLTFLVKPPLEIQITSPLDGETINKTKIIVKGSIKSDTKDIGIKVNGILAEIMGNQWLTNDVPLIVGTNAITVVVTDSYGNTNTKTITIYTNDIAQAVELSANITSGIPPLPVSFSVSTSFIPSSYQMDFEGDGVIDYTGTTFNNISRTYTSEGIFSPTIIVTDNQGNTFSDIIAIIVLNKNEIDTLLKGKWDGMKEALKAKEIEKALSYFDVESRDRYRAIFEALKNDMPVILDTFVEFNLVEFYKYTIEYEIVANENGVLYSYPITFIKGEDGIWRFRDF